MLDGIWSNILDHFWFKLSLLLTVALASSFLFARFKQPKILGQIAIGIVVGPSLLGVITVSDDPGDTAHRLAEFGAIIVLFMVGLECDFREIFTKRSILIALGGVILPWVSGFVLAELMLPSPDGDSLQKFAQSVFVGAALVATSVAITAGVMKEMKIIGSQVVKILLGAAIVDDILGMIVLAISSGIASGGGVELASLIWLVAAAVAFVALGAYLGTKFAIRLITTIQERGERRGIEESGFLLALCFGFLYAVIAEALGISAIVGAFVAGTVLARCELKAAFQKHLSVLEWVFAPIFFVSLGVLVDLRNMSVAIWVFAFVLTLVAIASKVLGCGIPAKLLGLSSKDSLSIGIGMSPRMEVAMIIALYGLTVGIISNDVYSVIVLMGLLTALVTPSILKKTMREAQAAGLPQGAAECRSTSTSGS
jgi:Kef-type K+ transport system membrane component KefB